MKRVSASAGVAAAAGMFFTLAAAWEVFGPLQGGHWAAMAASAMAGENMLRFHMFAAVVDYTAQHPLPSQYYVHHPYGLFVLEAIAHALFGHHPATVRLVAIACSAASVPFLYGLGKEMWGDARVAAVAVLAFVLVPVDLAFAGFSALEVPTTAFGLLFAWATARMWNGRRGRAAVALVALGAVGTAQCDWPGVVLVEAVAGLALLRFWTFPEVRRDEGQRLPRVWLAIAVLAGVLTVALYVGLFAAEGRLGQLGSAYHLRSEGAIDAPAHVFGPRRRMWVAWMITPAGLVVLVLGLAASAARLRRARFAILPVAWVLMAAAQYFVFRQGADVHIFWPQYFGVSIALALAEITSLLLAARRARAERAPESIRPRWLRISAAAVAAMVALPLLLFARVALPQLRQCRLTSGRFDEGGHYIDTDADAAIFAAWATADAPAGAVLAQIGSFSSGRNVEYTASRPVQMELLNFGRSGPDDPDRFVLLDARRTPVDHLRAYARLYSVQAVGPFWRVDRASHGEFRALRYEEHEPEGLARYFVAGEDLVRTVGPDADPWAAWEWQDLLGGAGSAPSEAPKTLEELRIAHNAAVRDHDADAASALLSRVLGLVGDASRADFGDDVHLRGVSIEPGPVPVATLLWQAGEQFVPLASAFAVRCRIVAPPPLWPSAVDFYEKDMAPPLAIPVELWKPGYVFVQRFVVRHRIGREACEGAFASDRLAPASGTARVPLFVLP